MNSHRQSVGDEGAEFHVRDVRGIAEARVVLRRGVNELRGPNGIGKTSLYGAIVGGLGGKVDLQPRDGARGGFGIVEGPGFKLRVGKVDRLTGEAEVSFVESGPLARLITGGNRKGRAERDRERLAAFTEIVRPPVDAGAIATLCDGEEDLAAWLAERATSGQVQDLLTAAGVLREEIHRRARAIEEQGAQWTGRASSAEDRAQKIEFTMAEEGLPAIEEPEPGEAVARATAAAMALQRAKTEAQARATLEERQERIRSGRGDRPDTAAAVQAERRAHEEVEAATARVAALERQLAGAREKLRGARELARQASVALAERETLAMRWDDEGLILSQPITNAAGRPLATEDDVLDAQLALDEAQVAERAHRQSVDLGAARTEHKEAKRQVFNAEGRAEEMRLLARTVPDRMALLLEKMGVKGVTIVEGRLTYAPEPGVLLDFDERLSSGQQVDVALGIFASVTEPDSIIGLEPEFWAKLDPQHRQDFAGKAYDHGLIIMTEIPADGPLAVAHQTGGRGPEGEEAIV